MGIMQFFGYQKVEPAIGDELYTSYVYSYGFEQSVIAHRSIRYRTRRTYAEFIQFFQ